ncbi:MAG TPA: ComEC/Rec2 family competence protein [Candidatus Limnocylindrales bacterium]
MPRSGWLAIGAVVEALAATAGPGIATSIAVLAIATISGSGAIRLAGRAGHGRTVLAGASAIGLGVLLVGGRALAFSAVGASATTTAIDASAGVEAAVLSVSPPKGVEQIALIRIADGPGADGPLVEALLPRYPEIGPGDRIAVRGSLRPPGDDDFGAYLRRLGAAGSLRSATLAVVAGPEGPQGLLDGIRQGSADALARALPEPQAGLADGILIGLRERVNRDLAAAFTTAGVSHIVAISGWNIAIVAATVAAVLGTRVGPRSRTAITLVAIAGYTLIAGASPSVDRAAVMAAIGLTARAAGRSSSALAALGWAALLLLLIDPATVADPGFALSGLATAGLIAWSGPLTGRLGSVRGHRLPGWLAESLAISIAAEVATLPIVLLTFGRLAIVAPLANLVIVPIVPPAMAAGALALGSGWLGALGLPPAIVIVLGLPAWALLGLMVGLVRLAADLPFASVTLPPPLNVVAAGIAAGIALFAVGGSHVRRTNEAVQGHRA